MNSVENGRKTPLLFSTFIFEYEHESGNDAAGNEIKNELSVFRKRTNLIGIMSNTVGIRKFNTKYRPTVHNFKNVHDQTKKCMITYSFQERKHALQWAPSAMPKAYCCHLSGSKRYFICTMKHLFLLLFVHYNPMKTCSHVINNPPFLLIEWNSKNLPNNRIL